MAGYPSRHGTVAVDDISITERVLEGVATRQDAPV
jgi:hypothetical protein